MRTRRTASGKSLNSRTPSIFSRAAGVTVSRFSIIASMVDESAQGRQRLVVGEHAGERIADGADALHGAADRPAVRAQRRIVQLVPGDRHAHRGAGDWPGAVWRDERLVDDVLGVVQPRLAPAGSFRPLPSGEVGHHRTDRAGDALDPVTRVLERRSAGDADPDLDPTLAGDLGMTDDAEMLERGAVQTRQ